MDGDGVETIGVKAGAYFDHGGDGFAEQTGWVGADDGLLVWDRNGDGRINNGKELFGSETLLSSGTKAANGYAALGELDSNADGKVDVNDAAFANLKVWKDLDGDGYSAASELISLTDAGVQSINTGATGSTYVDPAGNAHKLTGSFTKTDGTTGSTADVWFQTDPLYTIQEEYLTVPAAIAALPDLRGYGNAYDLQQAMVRDTTGSLKTLVQNFVAETNPGNRNQLLEQILFKWTGANTVDPTSRGIYFNAQKLVAMEKFYGRNYVGSNGSSDPACDSGAKLEASYQGLYSLIHAQLMAQTHLKGFYDLITYSWDTVTQSIRGDLSGVVSALQVQLAADPGAGRLALSEFARSVKELQAETTLNLSAFRNTLAAINPEWGVIVDAAHTRTFLGTSAGDTLAGTTGDDYLHGGAGNDILSDTAGQNVIDAGAGNDSIILGRWGYDVVYGGTGDDNVGFTWFLDGYDAGWADHVARIVGGLGNDYLHGSTGADIYVFNRGDGADTVWDESVNARGWNYNNDPDRIEFGAGIVLGDLVFERWNDHLKIRVTDPNSPASTDQITIENWYASDLYKIETFAFANGTTLTRDGVQIASTYLSGGAGNDTLRAGSPGIYTLDGGDGNDTITTVNNASSTLIGGAGDDFLLVDRDGGSPLTANTFSGGAGNDSLYGSASTDTYLFNRGDGSDTVNDYDYGAQGATDTISFGTGINPLDLVFSRNGDHLTLSVHNSTDSVNVQWWYAAPSHHHVETVRAGNGSTLVDSRVDQLIQAMATFSAQNGGISWDQAIDQRPNDVQAILAANWMPAG